MNILLTGASGFVGLNLLERLLSQGHCVIAVSMDQLPDAARREFERLPGRLEPVQGDVRDEAALSKILDSLTLGAIFAGAAITAGALRERESPAAIFDVNLTSVVRLIALAARHRVRRLVALSSSAAMGERLFGDAPLTEEDAPQPVTLYAITKAALESVARRWATLSPDAPQVTVGRVSAVFGPWERATGVRDSLSPMHAIAVAAIQGTPIAPLPQGGRRDWVYASFVAGALEWMLTAPRLEHSLYNISAGITWHPREFADALIASGLAVVERPRATEIRFNDDLSRTRTYLDIQRLSQEYAPPPAPREAAASYARWVAAHADWFRQ